MSYESQLVANGVVQERTPTSLCGPTAPLSAGRVRVRAEDRTSVTTLVTRANTYIRQVPWYGPTVALS